MRAGKVDQLGRLIVGAGRAKIHEQLRDRVLRRARHADGGADAVALHQGADDLRALLSGQAVSWVECTAFVMTLQKGARNCHANCTTPERMKDQVIQLRVADAEKRGFQAAANLAGIPLSSWVRERLRLAAIRDLESAGQRIPFIEALELGTPDA